jgi:protein MpaA
MRKKIIRVIHNFFLFSFLILTALSCNTSLVEVPKELPGKDYLTKIPSEAHPPTMEKTAHERKTKKEFCDRVNLEFKQFGWNRIICNPDRWEIFNYSSRGNPILYQRFGFNDPGNRGPVNLIFCGVHGDESPAVYICFHLVREILFDNPQALKDYRLIVAPIVNPDGFFANTRQNGNGVDPNRNLPTKNWNRSAQKVWFENNKDPRKYPGERSGSEAESTLQTYLINKYKPDKIISVHAPLGFLDFDGPGDQKYFNLNRVEQRAKYLGLNIEANTNKFLKLIDFCFYPGSLGNYAGNERKIPTYTLELPTTKPSKANEYWAALRFALMKALRFKVYDGEEGNPFFMVQNMLQNIAYTESETANNAKSDAENKNVTQ